MDPLLILHAAATCFLCGLIWTVQIVHYPLFARVGTDAFPGYEREHQARITRVVAPAMLVELLLAILLLARPPAGGSGWAAALGMALLGWIWISTLALAVPRHRELECGFGLDAHRALLRANWQRTAAWSLRAALALWMLAAPEVSP